MHRDDDISNPAQPRNPVEKVFCNGISQSYKPTTFKKKYLSHFDFVFNN